jgi:flagellar hook assembly protein FlgD
VVRFTPILSAVPTGGASATAAGVAITSAAAAPLASGAVQVTYTLSAPAQVRARVMNIAGRPIRTVAAQQEAAAGANTLLWDGRSDAGVAVPNGAYFVELLAQTADGAQARVLASAHLNR